MPLCSSPKMGQCDCVKKPVKKTAFKNSILKTTTG
jgi:hypothetical protein